MLPSALRLTAVLINSLNTIIFNEINSCLPMARPPDEILLEIAGHLSDEYDERSSRDEDDVKEINSH